MVRVKANRSGDMRRFVLADDANFEQLCAQLRAVYGMASFVVKYKDDEGDLVTVTCDAELKEAVMSVGDGGLLRIDVLPSNQGAAVPAARLPQPGVLPASSFPVPPPVNVPVPPPVILPVPPPLSMPVQPPPVSHTPPMAPMTGMLPPGVPPVAPPHVPPHGQPPHPPPHGGPPHGPPRGGLPHSPPHGQPPHPPPHVPPPIPHQYPRNPPYPRHPPMPSHLSAGRTASRTPVPPITELPLQARRAPATAPGPSSAPASQERDDSTPPEPSRTSSGAGPSSRPNSSGAGPSSRPNPSGSGSTGASWSVELDAQEMLGNLSGIFSNTFGSLGSLGALGGLGGLSSGGSGSSQRGNGYGRESGTAAREWTRAEWLQTFGISEENWGRFMLDWNPRSLGGGFANISDATMDALRILMSSLMRSAGAMALMSAVPVALPALRGFLAELQSGVAVTPERIEALGHALTAALTATLGAENARRIADFARTAAQDEAVLALLQRVSNMRPSSWGGGNAAASAAATAAADATRSAESGAAEAVGRVERAMSILGRLDVHAGISCDACNTAPIVGVRYWCTSEAGYDLCPRCHADDSVSKEGRTFLAIEFPWEAEIGRTLVPRPILSYGARGNEVMFLQHLLTRLGYMQPSDYRVRTGFYGPRTANAVNSMRRACGLSIQGTYGLYDEVAAASLLSIVEAGIPPATAAGQTQQGDTPVQSEDTPAAA